MEREPQRWPVPDSRPRPEWLVFVFALLCAGLGGTLMALGMVDACRGVRVEVSSADGVRWCDHAVRQGRWVVLAVAPAGFSVSVMRVFPPRGPARRYAWIALAVLDMCLGGVGVALAGGLPSSTVGAALGLLP